MSTSKRAYDREQRERRVESAGLGRRSVVKRILAVPLRAGNQFRKRTKRRWTQLLLRLGPSYRNLKRLGIIDDFNGYPTEAFAPIYADLWGLYLVVMERKPAVVLELGGGYSTFVLAHAARTLRGKGHEVKFFSVDESDHWQRVVMNQMPKDLRPFVHFHWSEPRVAEVEGERVSIFQSLPVDSCDFLYVDGGHVPGVGSAADALLLERNAPSDYAIQIDGRKKTVAFLKRRLKLDYDVGPGLNGVQTLFVRRS